MSGSRSQSQAASPYRRKRSNTVQSALRSPAPPSPALIGDSIDLSLWVHDTAPASPPDVILNPDHWPGICDGDVVRITELGESIGDEDEDDNEDESEKRGYLFTVKRPGEETRISNTLQVSLRFFSTVQKSQEYHRYLSQKGLLKHLAFVTTQTCG